MKILCWLGIHFYQESKVLNVLKCKNCEKRKAKWHLTDLPKCMN